MNRHWLIGLGALAMTACTLDSVADENQSENLNETAARVEGGKFQNTELSYNSTGNLWAITKEYVTAKRVAPAPSEPLPIRAISPSELAQQTGPVLYRLGHSTVLIKLDDEFVLTDPVFSDRASPVQWAGPKRFHQPPIALEQLPNIKAVVISHDHYDHLDKASVVALKDKVEVFVVPLRVGEHLKSWGINQSQIIELDWWQEVKLGSLTLTATPAQHFSGRGLMDRDQTLWASWVIAGQQAKLFFGGDSGYFSGFKTIGERLGPFDITMIETGAYNKLWREIHMMPEQSLQAHIDLGGKAMLPIHNSTFDLALHDWYEPLEIVHELALRHDVQMIAPLFGQAVDVRSPEPVTAWWREVEPVQEGAREALAAQ